MIKAINLDRDRFARATYSRPSKSEVTYWLKGPTIKDPWMTDRETFDQYCSMIEEQDWDKYEYAVAKWHLTSVRIYDSSYEAKAFDLSWTEMKTLQEEFTTILNVDFSEADWSPLEDYYH